MPTPERVKISSSKEWGVRPSMKWTLPTPWSRESRAEWILGSMPPEMVPSEMSSLASERLIEGIKVLWSVGSERMPGTSER